MNDEENKTPKKLNKIIRIIAVIAAIFIVLNPEFLAFGIIADAAFFDMLVLLLGLQLHGFFGSVLSHIKLTITTLWIYLKPK